MKTKLIEVTQTSHFNYGKFMVARFDDAEWDYRARIEGTAEHTGPPLLRSLGWGPEHVWVLDLQTGEGICVRPGGSATADLNTHQVWVCPMFEPFLAWLYTQDLGDLDALPDRLELPAAEAPEELFGYRRGPDGRAFTGLCSAHRDGEDPDCNLCYPNMGR